MINYPTLGCAISAICLSGAAWAQSATTLKDAVERSILRNPEVTFKYQNLLAADRAQDAVKGAWRPRIDLEARTGAERTSSPVQSSDLSFNRSLVTLQLRQTLFDGFATHREVQRTGHNRWVAYYELLSASDQMALEVTRAYIDVQRYRALVELARANYASHADVHARLTSRVNSGVGRRVDLEQAAGRLALAESNWLAEASNLHDVSQRYQRLVGETPAANLDAAPSLSEFLPAREGFERNTVSHNPEFLAAVSTIRAYRADAQLRRASNHPTLEFRASNTQETNRNGISGNFRDSALQLVLNYNLYRGGTDAATVAQSVAKLNAAYALRDKACRDIRQTALISLNDVAKLETQIGFLSQHELSTSKTHEAYRQQFDIGQRSLLDLLDTENELYEARRALSNGEMDLILAKARVLASNGSLLGALQLRPIEAEIPTNPGGTEDTDDSQLCAAELLTELTLDKTVATTTGNNAVLGVAKPTPAPAPVPLPAGPSANCLALTPFVNQWSAAWSKKDVPGFLAHYSGNFVPALNMKRSEWETLRTKRLKKDGEISITLQDIKIPRCDANGAEISFNQDYKSNDYNDNVGKILILEFIQGQWKIVRENVTKGRNY